MINATNGFYDKVKRLMWDYKNSKPWREESVGEMLSGVSSRSYSFEEAVDELVARIKKLDKVNELAAHKVIRQKFIDAGWKGATGFTSQHYKEKRDGLIGALYKQMQSPAKNSDLWKEKQLMMRHYWNAIEKKAEDIERDESSNEERAAAAELVG